jgi:hypothetical protein
MTSIQKANDPASAFSSPVFDRPISLAANSTSFLIFLAAAVGLQYPGHVPTDGITVWYEARNAVHFSQHPVAMALIFRVFDKIAPGPGLYTIFELTVLWSAIWTLIATYRPKILWAIGLYALVLIYPPLLATNALLVKDVLSSHLALLACALVIRAPTTGWRAILLWSSAFALTALATLIRYQFGLIALVLFVWLFWQHRRISKPIGAIAISCVAGFFVMAALVQIASSSTFKIDHNINVGMEVRENNIGNNDLERSIRKIYVYDIAGVIVGNREASLPIFSTNHLDVKQLKDTAIRLYNPDKVDHLWESGGLFAELRNTPTSVIEEQWWKSISISPKAFVEHRLKTFGALLGFAGVYSCFPATTGIHHTPPDLANALHAQDYKPAFDTAILSSRYFPIRPLFPPVIYFVLSVAILARSLMTQRYDGVLLCSAGVLYELTFLLLPQSCDIRYSYFMILTSILSGFVVLLHRPKEIH